MSGLWSAQPASIKLDELDVFAPCSDAVFRKLLLAEPANVTRVGDRDEASPQREAAAGGGAARVSVRPRPRTGRSLPSR
jgi:hypothetical protein